MSIKAIRVLLPEDNVGGARLAPLTSEEEGRRAIELAWESTVLQAAKRLSMEHFSAVILDVN
jgi:hypothetical protein